MINATYINENNESIEVQFNERTSINLSGDVYTIYGQDSAGNPYRAIALVDEDKNTVDGIENIVPYTSNQRAKELLMYDENPFNVAAGDLAKTPEFRNWLHELTVAGYEKNIMIPTEHADAIAGIFVLWKGYPIERCLEAYQDFVRRWKALHSPGGDLYNGKSFN